jgi:pyruvate/2-oxoglutarate dehydrogenase complex dihydrolipoamide dehydrogenase (E3) component/uncharacterized membrane protein YdjX (TVP38/TMEM64 family)
MKRIIVFLLIIAAIFFMADWFDLSQHLTLSQLKHHQLYLHSLVQDFPVQSVVIYFIAYIVMAGLALPGALIFTLAGGALFGLATGVILASFASTLGALASFLVARFFLHDFVQTRYQQRLTVINQKIQQQGATYLLFLRLVPAFPFFMVNLLMALTPISARTYYIVSQIGMLPATFIFVNAGTELAKISSVDDILSIPLLLSLLLLACLPFISKQLAKRVSCWRLYKSWQRPKKFDYHTIVIGGGAAGLVAAYTTQTLQGKVALIEKHQMGGDCLNTGCVPSKSILRTAKFIHDIGQHSNYGVQQAEFKLQFQQVMQRVREKISTIAPKDSIKRYNDMGVDCFQAHAQLLSPWQVEAVSKNSKITISAKNIILAGGATPNVPTIPGLENINYYTSDNIWHLDHLPEKLLIIGAGPIGCELGQAFVRLGAEVTMINRNERILTNEDPQAAHALQYALQQDGVKILNNFNPLRIDDNSKNFSLMGEQHNEILHIAFSHCLIATGRKPSLLGCEALDIETNSHGQVITNDKQQTNYPNIYACGDITSPLQYTHSASHQAWYAAFNALFRPFKQFNCQLNHIPRAIYTDPEVASLGISEQQAIQKNIPHEISYFAMDDVDRAITDEATTGFIKVITRRNNDKILGVCIVGEHSSELIAEFVLAKTHNLGLNKILQTVHLYPTRGEINRLVAGQWRQKKFTAYQRKLLKLFQNWRLGN